MRDDLSVRRPVATLHEVSHDPTLEAKVELVDGRRMTALELLQEYHDRAAAFVAERPAASPTPTPPRSCTGGARCSTGWPATRWRPGARSTGSPSSPCSRATASATPSAGATRGSRPSTSSGPTCAPTAASPTGSWRPTGSRCSSTRPTSSPPSRSRPPDTRAWFRGQCLRRFPDAVVAASWDSVIFDVAGPAHPAAGADARAAQGHRGGRRRPRALGPRRRVAARGTRAQRGGPPPAARRSARPSHGVPRPVPSTSLIRTAPTRLGAVHLQEESPWPVRSRSSRSVVTTAGRTTPPRPRPRAPAVQTSEIDDILDEIDGVLESNAEEFVRGFVQKGGQ